VKFHFLSSLLIALSLIPLIQSCQRIDPSVYECQQLLEEINGIVIEAQSITLPEQNKTNTDPNVEPNLELWLQAADVLQKGSESIAALPVKTEILKDYQTEISQVYGEQAQATYEMVEAWQQKNLMKAIAAQKRTKQAGELEQTTGKALNDYCQAQEEALNP
jgi:catalase